MIQIDLEKGIVVNTEQGKNHEYPIGSPQSFSIISKAWLRAGWDTKYVYGFTWLGRPIIQLPEDMIRIQEVIYSVKPQTIIETGVAHGGSLIYYASILEAMGGGRIIGIDIEIRPNNRVAIENHRMSKNITLIEGSSVAAEVVELVREMMNPDEQVLVMLDSNHSKEHVLGELRAYSEFVSPGSYIVAADGIMAELVGAPRTKEEWRWDNPKAAAEEFVAEDSRFVIEEPEFMFNEGEITERVTYWPSAFVKRIR
jgi:cephalosporin hydroxylase